MTTRIAVDCDGVLADFNGLALHHINTMLGTAYTPEDVTTFDFRNLIPHESKQRVAFREALDSSHASRLGEYPHARDLIHRLAHLGDVWVVTSPMHKNPTWCTERLAWLEHHLGIDRHRVAFMSDKSAFDGRVLIDDFAGNLHQFEDGGEGRRGILWRMPYSTDGGVVPWDGWWTQSVDGAVEAVSYALKHGDDAAPRAGYDRRWV